MRLPEAYRRYLPYLPAAVAALLAIPVLGFAYLWDDYGFVTNAIFYRLHDWVPDPADPFYRPISRGVYFTLVGLAGRDGPALGHALNIIFLLAIIVLIGSLASRLAGRSVGTLASLVYACLGAAPGLVAWVCCDQALLAILFTMIALNLRLSGRNVAAYVATCAALLSKETTLAVIPVLVLFDWILGRKPYRIARQATAYALLVTLWGTIHPAVRILLSRGLRSGATGYVGLEHPERWPVHLVRYLLTLFNVPAFASPPSWPLYGVPLFLGAGVLTLLLIREIHREPQFVEERSVPFSRLILLGAALATGPLILTSTMIRGWAPYYVGFPAIGFCLMAAALLARFPERTQIVAFGIFLALGVWSRGELKDPEETSEGNFRVVSDALRQVETGFRRLYPSFPQDTRILLSVQAHGKGGIYTHLYVFQTLRIWYRDRSLRTIRPEARTPYTGPEVFAVIGPDRDIIDIDPRTLFARSASRRDPDYHVCETAVRAYAMGLAGSGETDAAVTTLLHMPEINPGLQSVHRRMAAMFLLDENRQLEAKAILDSTVVLPRGVALADVQAVLAEQPPKKVYDDLALLAFGISENDTTSMRQLMQWFADNHYAEVAIRFARRVEGLVPGDTGAALVTRQMNAYMKKMGRDLPKSDAVE